MFKASLFLLIAIDLEAESTQRRHPTICSGCNQNTGNVNVHLCRGRKNGPPYILTGYSC